MPPVVGGEVDLDRDPLSLDVPLADDAVAVPAAGLVLPGRLLVPGVAAHAALAPVLVVLDCGRVTIAGRTR